MLSGLIFVFFGTVVWSAYHHMGEKDSPRFLEVYPDKAGTKLDRCTLCHSGGEYEQRPGQWVSLGSCQCCHYSYGYDGSGNIVETLNNYGKDYWLHGRNADAIRAIDEMDSDGDGFTNAEEIRANAYPGDASDYPGKAIAPFRVYTRAQLEAMPQHTQFMLLNASRSRDRYVEYTGVPVEELLADAGILNSATGITVYAPDGWSNYHTLEPDPEGILYHVNGIYPSSTGGIATFGGRFCIMLMAFIPRPHIIIIPKPI